MTRGRPKTFDDTEVLERAMQVFWRQGYEATSLEDLVDAMEIPRQSLYRTFTDKHTLFLRALEHYDANVTSIVIQTLNGEGAAITNLKSLFELWNRSVTSSSRMGCLMVNTAAQVSQSDSRVAKIVNANQMRLVKAIEKCVQRAQFEGDVDSSIDPKIAARTLSATVNGLMCMSRAGVAKSFKTDVLAGLPSIVGIK